MKTIRFIAPYLRPYVWHLAAGILCIPLATFSALSIPRLMGDAVDHLETRPSEMGPVIGIGGWILFYAACRAAGLFASRYFIIGASRRLEFDLRNRLFEHLLGLDRDFYHSARTGDIMTRATLDVEAARILGGPVIMYSISGLFMLGIAIPLMLSVDRYLTLLVMAPLCLLTFLVRVVGPRVHVASRQAQEALAAVSSFAQQNFGGIRVVKAFAMEEREIDAFERLSRSYHDRSLATERIANWMRPIVVTAGETAVVLLLLVGGTRILDGTLSLGDFVKVSGYQAMLIWPMISLGWIINQLYRGVASVDRLRQVFSRRSTVAASSTPAAAGDPSIPKRFAGDVEIRRLSFAIGDRTILRDVSIRAPAGSTIAILGRTGAGKSVLVSLLPRLHAVPDGTIFLDGIDVNRIPLPALRRAIGFVPQETFLFSRSIAENVGFAVWDDDDRERLEEEVRRYGAISRFDKDLDQLRGGYDEAVGERGVTLSGGQKQRVAISRALMAEPAVLVLDDALSAVDTHTEEEILRNLRQATRGLTVIIVAHRVSSVRWADRIYVLDRGTVAETGSHVELRRLGGLYEELYRQQLFADELEEM